jgi:hypothetical protein
LVNQQLNHSSLPFPLWSVLYLSALQAHLPRGFIQNTNTLSVHPRTLASITTMALTDKQLASATATPATNEKGEHLEQPDHPPRPPSPPQSIDLAYQFLKQHSQVADAPNEERIKALLWRVDLRIVPIMFACYTMQFLDKVLINVSRHGRDVIWAVVG